MLFIPVNSRKPNNSKLSAILPMQFNPSKYLREVQMVSGPEGPMAGKWCRILHVMTQPNPWRQNYSAEVLVKVTVLIHLKRQLLFPHCSSMLKVWKVNFWKGVVPWSKDHCMVSTDRCQFFYSRSLPNIVS